MTNKFYICETCGNIIQKVEDSKVPVFCCGKAMKELVPNTTDGAFEKHLPVVTVDGNKVTVVVGSVEHPMTEAHLISWIVLETKKSWYRKHLTHTDKPIAVFTLEEGDDAVAAYEYCNLHGFWKTEIK